MRDRMLHSFTIAKHLGAIYNPRDQMGTLFPAFLQECGEVNPVVRSEDIVCCINNIINTPFFRSSSVCPLQSTALGNRHSNDRIFRR